MATKDEGPLPHVQVVVQGVVAAAEHASALFPADPEAGIQAVLCGGLPLVAYGEIQHGASDGQKLLILAAGGMRLLIPAEHGDALLAQIAETLDAMGIPDPDGPIEEPDGETNGEAG